MFEWMLTSSVLIVIVIAVRFVFMGKISPRLQYGLWFLVLLRLLCPLMIMDSSFSVLNVLDTFRQGELEKEVDSFAGGEYTEVEVETPLAENDAGNRYGADDQQADVSWNEYNMTDVPQDGGLDDAATENTVQMHDEASSSRCIDISFVGKLVWIAGMVVIGLGIIFANVRFSVRLCRVRQYRGMEGKLPVYEVEQLATPCLFGILKLAIYVPRELYEEGQEKMLRFALVHEKNHYRHGDPVWALLRSICLVLHWYNPLVWIAVILSRRDSELACDDSTVRELGEECRTDYGKALIVWTAGKPETGDFLCCATSLSSGKKSIKERITVLAKKPKMLMVSATAIALIVVTAVVISFTGKKEESDLAEIVPTRKPIEVGVTGTQEEDAIVTDTPGISANHSSDKEEALPSTYYEVIESTTVDNDYFSMTVPEELVGNVGYQVYFEHDAKGRRRMSITFVMDSLADTVGAGVWRDSAEEEERILEENSFGTLCWIAWRGLEEMERGDYSFANAPFESLLLYTGEVDFEKMDALNRYVYGFGPERPPIDYNADRTGAYCLYNPTDVQFTMIESETYFRYEMLLEEAFSTFQAKEYPYDTCDTLRYEILLDFLRAEEAVSWFSRYDAPDALTEEFVAHFYSTYQPDIDASGENTVYYSPDGVEVTENESERLWSEDGNVYYLPMRDYGLTSMSELENYLKNYLPQEMVEELLQKPREDGYMPFLEQDGVLYVLRSGMVGQHYLTGGREYVITVEDNGTYATIQMHATMQQYGDEVEMDFTYVMELGADGIWRVAEPFELAIEVMAAE